MLDKVKDLHSNNTVSLMMGGCGAKVTTEKWAYDHEPDKEILSLSSNGKAVYKETEYTYNKDDTYIHLKDNSGNITDLRYLIDGEKMIVYETSTYYRDGGETEDGIYGVWRQDNGWLFRSRRRISSREATGSTRMNSRSSLCTAIRYRMRSFITASTVTT